MIPRETDEQSAFVQWFRLQYSGVLIFAIPNGSHLAGDGARRAMQIAKLKREGMVPGVPDLFIPEWRTWVEMKRAKGGRVSDDQTAIISQLRKIGHSVIVAHGFEDARDQLIARGEVMA